MTYLVYCLLCTVYCNINFVHAQEHAQVLTILSVVSSVFTVYFYTLFTVDCVLITFFSLTLHNFKPEPGHIDIQQNCAHCLGNAQSQSRIRKYKEGSMQ